MSTVSPEKVLVGAPLLQLFEKNAKTKVKFVQKIIKMSTDTIRKQMLKTRSKDTNRYWQKLIVRLNNWFMWPRFICMAGSLPKDLELR